MSGPQIIGLVVSGFSLVVMAIIYVGIRRDEQRLQERSDKEAT